jgi:hypothetical protein
MSRELTGCHFRIDVEVIEKNIKIEDEVLNLEFERRKWPSGNSLFVA